MNTESFTRSSRILGGRRLISSSSWLDNLRSNNIQGQILEEVIDVDRKLELFSNEQLSVLNPRRLYGQGLLSFSSSIYRHHKIEALHLSDGREERINLMMEGSAR